MNATTYRFRVGRFECMAIHDGAHTYTADLYFHDVPAEPLAQALSDHAIPPERIPSPYSALLVKAGAHQVMIDTGCGAFFPGVGELLDNLTQAGVDSGAIDTVILTHGHPDHLGGTVSAEGRPVFAHARHVVWRDEWDYWTSEASEAHPLNREFVSYARHNLLPLQGQLELLEREMEVVPGILAIPALGHTPGQMAVLVHSAGDELLYISDAALHPIHLEHPAWYPIYDLDPAQATATKRTLFDRAAAERALVLALHFPPFPSLGHVVRRGEGWHWEPAVTPSEEAADLGVMPS
jgi:glyoxylase-like metal-dependent hydrolase (beta-lactamase superfamily II)